MASVVNQKHVFASLANQYPFADVLIDTSKHWDQILHNYLPEPEFKLQTILLSKLPHEFAYSFLGHHPTRQIVEGFRVWLSTYEYLLKRLDEFCTYSHHFLQKVNAPIISPDDVMRLTYSKVATQTANSVKRICEFAETCFDENALRRWQHPGNCIIGGNNSVYAQVSGNQNFFREGSEYLQGKYVGRFGQIFLDEEWRSNSTFVEECRTQYKTFRTRMEAILPLLGQPDWQKIVSDLDN